MTFISQAVFLINSATWCVNSWLVFWRHLHVMFVCSRTHRITITNFCLGKHLVSEEDLLKDQRGSPAYISPDVLSGENPAFLSVCVCVWLTWLTLHVTTVIKAHKPNHLHGPNQDSSRKPSAWMSNSYVYWSHYLCCLPQDLTC